MTIETTENTITPAEWCGTDGRPTSNGLKLAKQVLQMGCTFGRMSVDDANDLIAAVPTTRTRRIEITDRDIEVFTAKMELRKRYREGKLSAEEIKYVEQSLPGWKWGRK